MQNIYLIGSEFEATYN